MPTWACLSSKWDTVRKRVCVQAGARCCAIAALHRSLQPTARKASSACASLKQWCDHPDPDISHARPQGSAAQHSTTNDCHEPMKTTVLAFKGEEGGPAGPVPLPCRTSAMPCPGPPNGRTPLLGLAWTHAAWHWPGSGIPSRSVASSALHASRWVSSARVIPWHFRFFLLVLQHVTGPATLVSTSGVCSPSLRVLRVPHCEYSEYPTAGAPAQPQPTVQAENDVRTPPHTAGASTQSTLGST